MAEVSNTSSSESINQIGHDTVDYIKTLLANLEGENKFAQQRLYITELAQQFKKLTNIVIQAFKDERIPKENRIKYINKIQQRCTNQIKRIPNADWTEFQKELDQLRIVFSTDFTHKPLSFARQAVDKLNNLDGCETAMLKLIKMIRTEARKNLFNRHYQRLSNRRSKLVIACIGTLKAGKSSFINYLLDANICPTSVGRLTGRLIKIVYGDRTCVELCPKNAAVESKKIYCDEASVCQHVLPLTKLETNTDRSSPLCHDYIVIYLNREELLDIELWDVPGFDDNTHLDKLIGTILGDADLIFALTPLNEDVRSSFAKLIETALKLSRNACDNVETVENNNNLTPLCANICFVITKIDIVKKDVGAATIVDEALQDLRTHIYEKFPSLKIEKSGNNFIPMCTRLSHDVPTYVQCYEQFNNKAASFVNWGVQVAIELRLRYLEDIINQILDYYDTDRASERLELLKRLVQQILPQVEKKLADELQGIFEQVENAVMTKIQKVLKKKPILYSEDFEQKLILEANDLYERESADKKNDIQACIRKVVEEFLHSIYVNPRLSEPLDEIIRHLVIENPFHLPSGQLSHIDWYDSPKQTNHGGGFILEMVKRGWINLILHKKYYQRQLTNTIRDDIRDWIGQYSKKTKGDLSKLIMDQLESLTHHIGRKQIKLSAVRENSLAQKMFQILQKDTVVDAVKTIFLMIHDTRFRIQYPQSRTYTSIEPLGSSNFPVYSADLTNNGGTVVISAAAKRVPKNAFNIQEMRYMKKLHHPNLLKLYGVLKCSDHDDLYDIFMERLSFTLSAYLAYHRQHNGIHESSVDTMIKEIVAGLNYLHQNDFIHRDIKPQNILIKVNKDHSHEIQIGDFGFIHQFPISCRGTEGYFPPELLTGMRTEQNVLIGTKSDIYALGVTIQHMIESLPAQSNG